MLFSALLLFGPRVPISVWSTTAGTLVHCGGTSVQKTQQLQMETMLNILNFEFIKHLQTDLSYYI